MSIFPNNHEQKTNDEYEGAQHRLFIINRAVQVAREVADREDPLNVARGIEAFEAFHRPVVPPSTVEIAYTEPSPEITPNKDTSPRSDENVIRLADARKSIEESLDAAA